MRMSNAISTRRVGQTLRANASRHVRAPIELAYAAYVDATGLARWMNVKAIVDRTGPLDVPGTRFRAAVYGPYRPIVEVLAVDRPFLHEMGGEGVFGIDWRWSARFVGQDGGTVVTLEEEAFFPAGLISGWLRGTQDGGRMERAAVRRLATFAEAVEAEAAAVEAEATAVQVAAAAPREEARP
jgi:hypothetical protein